MQRLKNISNIIKDYLKVKNKLILILWLFLITLKIYESTYSTQTCNIYNIYSSCPDSFNVKLITKFKELHD
jgi:hypothetical protein